MSINSPFTSPFKPGALPVRPSTDGMVDRNHRINIPTAYNTPQQVKPHGKHSLLKTLVYGSAALGLSTLVFKRFAPETFAKLAESVQKHTPAQAQDFKNYLSGQAGKLQQNNYINALLNKAEPLTNALKKIWK